MNNFRSEDNHTLPVNKKTSSRYFIRNLYIFFIFRKLFIIFALISVISYMLLQSGGTIIGKITEENDFER